MYYATLTSSGADSVSVFFQSSAIDVYVYEIAGVLISSVPSGVGTGTCCGPTSTTSVSFQPGAFLLDVLGTLCGSPPPTPTGGFAFSTENSGTKCAYAQYSTSGAATPTTFTTGNFGRNWVAVGIALDPAPTPPPPIPEYPFGMLMLAILMVVSYTVIRRRIQPPKT